MNSASPSTHSDWEAKLILAGLGGQGVVFATRLLANTAVALGLPVMASETHGMSQRGGSVLSHLKIGGSEAPLIRKGTADFLLAFDRHEALRNLPYLRREGVAFINSPDPLPEEVSPHVARLGLRINLIPASRLAVELGSATVANVVLIGYAVAHPEFCIPTQALEETLASTSAKRLEVNLRALRAGGQHRSAPAPLSSEPAARLGA